MEKGLVRIFSDSDSDKTITSWFGREGGFVCSVQSFFNQKPSLESIQLLEDSQLWVISYADWERIMVEFPELNLHFRKVYQYYLTVYDARVYLLRQKNAEKQYKVFLKRYPKLANRVHIKYIAQYLNIHPVTLSKIRNKLKNSKL
ncbi:MAG: Crp/Fnr family transcriptional regulator [Runella slithyformis]|nr:MAG: Crp/Fnr family transcriptional regulator [Runella slithyformis]TAF24882.1 MAG: Crp/Fnr family transcriptional regulator [Runella slithyformis]TAF48906.1 MAG: Crp/Fnr family transcriptional regulator [Runella slithyformis]TAF79511.1 MAG: Crp/Fnr family transcriptional regulator [Runella slithyformis]